MEFFPFFWCRKHSVFTRFFIDYLGIHVPLYTYLYKYEKEWEQIERERERERLPFPFFFFSCAKDKVRHA